MTYNGKATGSETLVSDIKDDPGVDERALAAEIQTRIVDAMGLRNRGLKFLASRGERGFYNLSRVCDVPSILIEPFFGDNIKDSEEFNKNKDFLAEGILQGFNNYINHKV